jgi:hypothetical protein
MPLAPRTARAIDLAISEREHGPILLGAAGQRLDRARHSLDRHAPYIVSTFVAGAAR